MLKKLLLGTMIATSLGLALPNVATGAVYVQIAPPAPRVEVVPAPRRGYVWAPGYWDWRRGRYVWVGGTWVRERPGHRYNGTRWVARDGRYYQEPGHWARNDRDRDGIPNKHDRDRDNDGTPNRYDQAPNNPTRR